MKRNTYAETTVEISTKRYAWLNLEEYMKHTREPTDMQRATWNLAIRMPQNRSNMHLERTWGRTQVKSFTLTKRTRTWLEHATMGKQTASKMVEIALCRYRMWRPMIEYITELTTELVEARREIKELRRELE